MRICRVIGSVVAINHFRVSRPRMWMLGFFFLAPSLTLVSSASPGQASGTPQLASSAVQQNGTLVIGGEAIKNNSKVTLSVVGSSLHIASGALTQDVNASSILDISTNEDSRQDITGAAKLATMAIPYGGGRVLSLFSHNVDVLTLEFTAADGGYHGVVFVLAKGQGAPIKKQLVAVGAKATVPLEQIAETNEQENKP